VDVVKGYQKYLFASLLTSITLFTIVLTGCKDEKKPIQVDKQSSVESVTPLSGVKYGYIKNIFQKEEQTFASIILLNYQSKGGEGESNPSRTVLQFPDSLDVLELPDAYLFSVKGKTPDQFLVTKDAKIEMQTLSYDPTGNFKFNENVDAHKFLKLFAENEFERYKKIPFKINYINGKINSITEQYIP